MLKYRKCINIKFSLFFKLFFYEMYSKELSFLLFTFLIKIEGVSLL